MNPHNPLLAYEPETKHGTEVVEPVLPEDSLEDRLKEVLCEYGVPINVITAIVTLVQQDTHAAPTVNTTAVRIETMRRLVELFPPHNFTITSWWAFNFAIESSNVRNVNISDITKMLGYKNRSTFLRSVQYWRKRLGIKSFAVRNESSRLGWQKRESRRATSSNS